MTEPDLDEYGDPIPPDSQPDDRRNNDGGRNWKLLREKAEKYDNEVEPLRRENAFLKAGIPDTPQGRLLQKAYDGEPTVEAIRQFAVEHGVIDATDEGVPAEELDALDRADAASQGGAYTPSRPPDMNALLRQAAGR